MKGDGQAAAEEGFNGLRRFLRILLGLISGAISGGILGAALLGVPTYLDPSCGFLGCSRDWTPIAVAVGSVFGGVPGAVIGVIIVIVSANRRKSLAIGAITGLVIMIILFVTGASGELLLRLSGVLSIPGGALVGLIVGEVLRLVPLFRNNEIPTGSNDLSGSEPTH